MSSARPPERGGRIRSRRGRLAAGRSRGAEGPRRPPVRPDRAADHHGLAVRRPDVHDVERLAVPGLHRRAAVALFVVALGLHVWRIRELTKSLGRRAPIWFMIAAAAVGLGGVLVALAGGPVGFVWAIVSGVLLGDIVGGLRARWIAVWVLRRRRGGVRRRLPDHPPGPSTRHCGARGAVRHRRARRVLRRLDVDRRRRATVVAQGRHRPGRLTPRRRRAGHRPRAAAPGRRPARHPRPRPRGRGVQERAGLAAAGDRPRPRPRRDGGGAAGRPRVAHRGAGARARHPQHRPRHRAGGGAGGARLRRGGARRARRPRRPSAPRPATCSAGCCGRR